MKRISILLSVLVFLGGSLVRADDIEIYFAPNEDSTPYVLLNLDASPNNFSTLFNTLSAAEVAMTVDSYNQLIDFRDGDDTCPVNKVGRWEVYRAVLATVLSEIDPLTNELRYANVHLALSSSNHKDNGGGTMLEGYIRLGSGGLEQILADLGEIPCDVNGDDAHDQIIMDTYLEWYSYLNGLPVQKGRATDKNFLGRTPVTPNYDPNTIVDDNVVNAVYDSPIDAAAECPILYSVTATMTGTAPGQDKKLKDVVAHGWEDSKFADAATMVAHMTVTDLLTGVSGFQPLSKGWVITDKNGDLDRGDVGEIAAAGGTTSLDVSNPRQLEEDLADVFGEVLSVSSTFVSASVPVNVFNQTRSLDNLFVALFEAERTLDWPGNIKRLRLLDDPNNPDGVFDSIVDQNGDPGLETTGRNKGRIFATALTFWTDENNLPPASDVSDPNDPRFIPTGADGRVVDRGGAGQQIAGVIQGGGGIIGDSNAEAANTRKVFLETASITDGGTNLADFSTALKSDTTIQALFGLTVGAADTEDAAEELIQWGRGQDLDDDDDDNRTNDARFWVLADAIHSRPFALNYGDTDSAGSGYDQETNPHIVLLFGTGDGMFHAILNTDSAGNDSGEELWGFYPREMLPQIARRRTPDIMYDGRDMRYGIDGEPVVLTNDKNGDGNLKHGDNDEVYVYYGLRRGGYSYYAMDISNPVDPKLAWKITETRSDTGSSDFEELGLTFSTPVATAVQFGDEPVDALIFGGGYHGGWDPNDPTAPSQFGKDINANGDAFGNAIYIVNARTGALIWKATQGSGSPTSTNYQHPLMVDSIPSKVIVLENRRGVAHRVYVGDTGGSLWRVDIPTVNEDDSNNDNDRDDQWFVSRLADLSPAGEDRRFFHPPEVVESITDDGTPFDGVVIQSGNRADPLDDRFTPEQNFLYYMRDYKVASGDPNDVIPNTLDPNTPRYTANDLADRTDCPGGIRCETLNSIGWRLGMPDSGEKGLSTPLVDAGRVFATTYIPGTPGVCGLPAEGSGHLYLVNLTDANAVSNQRIYDLGPGIPPDPVLIGEAILIPGGGPAGGIPGDDPNDPICEGPLCKSETVRLIPVYWRQPGIDGL